MIKLIKKTKNGEIEILANDEKQAEEFLKDSRFRRAEGSSHVAKGKGRNSENE